MVPKWRHRAGQLPRCTVRPAAALVGFGPSAARQASDARPSLGHLHLQSHLVRSPGVADQQLEHPVFRRRELHFALRAGTGVLADLLLVLVIDEQIHVRVLVALRRDGDFLADRERQNDGDEPLSFIVTVLPLNFAPSPASVDFTSAAPTPHSTTSANRAASAAHLPVLPGHDVLLLVAPSPFQRGRSRVLNAAAVPFAPSNARACASEGLTPMRAGPRRSPRAGVFVHGAWRAVRDARIPRLRKTNSISRQWCALSNCGMARTTEKVAEPSQAVPAWRNLTDTDAKEFAGFPKLDTLRMGNFQDDQLRVRLDRTPSQG